MSSGIVVPGLLAAVIGTALAATPTRAVDPTGVWMSQHGDTKIQITDCGGLLCGTVVWLKEPIDPKTGKPRTDKFNPDASKRGRPMLGLQVVNGLKPTAPGRWSGEIYHADEGFTVRVDLTVQSHRQARLEGCLLAVVCKTERWTRTD